MRRSAPPQRVMLDRLRQQIGSQVTHGASGSGAEALQLAEGLIGEVEVEALGEARWIEGPAVVCHAAHAGARDGVAGSRFRGVLQQMDAGSAQAASLSIAWLHR